jgi:hypothetical protein
VHVARTLWPNRGYSERVSNDASRRSSASSSGLSSGELECWSSIARMESVDAFNGKLSAENMFGGAWSSKVCSIDNE